MHKAGGYILSLLKNCGSGVFSSYILQHLLTIEGKACFPVLGEIQQHILTEYSLKKMSKIVNVAHLSNSKSLCIYDREVSHFRPGVACTAGGLRRFKKGSKSDEGEGSRGKGLSSPTPPHPLLICFAPLPDQLDQDGSGSFIIRPTILDHQLRRLDQVLITGFVLLTGDKIPGGISRT